MTSLVTLCERMADELDTQVAGLTGIRQHLHRPAAGLGNGAAPLFAVYLDRVTLRFATTQPDSRATQTWHVDYYVGDVLGIEAARGNDLAADAIDVGEQITRTVQGWGDGIPDGQGGTLEEYAEARRIIPQADGGTWRVRVVVEVESLQW